MTLAPSGAVAAPALRRALIRDERLLGLTRTVLRTRVGDVVVRSGRRRGDTATILLHGAAGSWTTWTPLLAASDRTQTPLTDIVAPDLPGWGESGTLAGVSCVEDLTDAVADVAASLGYPSWRVVGHSLGGVLALDLAARRPAETTAVALVSSSGIGVLDAVPHPVRGGMALPGFAGMLFAMRALALLGRNGHRGRAVVRALARCGALPVLTAPLFAGRVDPSVVAAFGGDVRPAAFAAAARIAASYDESVWRGIRCPVRSVRGTRDVFAAERDTAAFADLIEDFDEIRLADAGHFAHIERPDAVLALLAG